MFLSYFEVCYITIHINQSLGKQKVTSHLLPLRIAKAKSYREDTKKKYNDTYLPSLHHHPATSSGERLASM